MLIYKENGMVISFENVVVELTKRICALEKDLSDHVSHIDCSRDDKDVDRLIEFAGLTPTISDAYVVTTEVITTTDKPAVKEEPQEIDVADVQKALGEFANANSTNETIELVSTVMGRRKVMDATQEELAAILKLLK